jgi:hypothetical protein
VQHHPPLCHPERSRGICSLTFADNTTFHDATRIGF